MPRIAIWQSSKSSPPRRAGWMTSERWSQAGYRYSRSGRTSRPTCCAPHARRERRRCPTERSWNDCGNCCKKSRGAHTLRPYRPVQLRRPDRLLRCDLYRDLPRLRLLDLRQGHRQHAVLVGCLDGVGVDGGGQREAALEGAVSPLVAMYPLRALFGNLLLGPVNREDVVLEGDLDVLRHHARKLGHDADRVSLLDDVHRRHPRGGGAVAQLPIGPGQRVAQQPVQPVAQTDEVHREGVSRRIASGEEHTSSPPLTLRSVEARRLARASKQPVCHPTGPAACRDGKSGCLL